MTLVGKVYVRQEDDKKFEVIEEAVGDSSMMLSGPYVRIQEVGNDSPLAITGLPRDTILDKELYRVER